MRKHSILLFLSLWLSVTYAQGSFPSIGVPTFVSEVEIADGSLLLLGEATEQGLKESESFQIVDRRRLDAIFLAREEVRHEDYLASDRESIQAIGAEYLLIGRIHERELTPAEFINDKGLPAKSLNLRYRFTLSLLEVSTSRLMHSQKISLSSRFYTEMGQPEMDVPLESYIPQVEQQIATQLKRRSMTFARQGFQGGMQMVDVISQKSKRIEVILIASTMNTTVWQKIDLYVNERYEVAGDTLIRPVIIGQARVMSEQNRLYTCKVTDGDRALKTAYDAGQKIFAVPADLKSHWLVRLMFLGIID